MLQTDKTPEISEAVWKAWLKKNELQDKFRLARRLRVLAVSALLLMASVVLWRFTG